MTSTLRYDPFAPAMHQDPYPTYARLRAEQPLYHHERGFWAVSRFADVQLVARDWKTFANAPGVDLGEFAGLFGTGDFLDSDPPKHDRIRNVLRERFTPKAIRALEPALETRVESLLQGLFESREADLAEEFAFPLPVDTISDLLGVPAEDRSMVYKTCMAFLRKVPGEERPSASALHAVATIGEYFTDVVQDRRTADEDTLLGDIARGHRAGEVSSEEIPGTCTLLFAAGMETTAYLLTNSFLLLSQHPDQRRLLAKEPERIPQAIEELLRYDSPIQSLGRTTTRETELLGELLAKGERVLLLFGSANRDETRWDRAGELDVTRPLQRNLAFGEGIHHCLGAPLARLEAKVAIEMVLARAPDYEVKGEIARSDSHHGRGLVKLPVAIRPARYRSASSGGRP